MAKIIYETITDEIFEPVADDSIIEDLKRRLESKDYADEIEKELIKREQR